MINKRCPKCRLRYSEQENYCTKCGIELEKDENRCSENKTTCGSLTTYAKERQERNDI